MKLYRKNTTQNFLKHQNEIACKNIQGKKKKIHQTFLDEKITPTFYLKSTPDSIMKYFTLKFYFRKVTPYSEKISRKNKNFTPNNKTFAPNLIFFLPDQKSFARYINIFIPN